VWEGVGKKQKLLIKHEKCIERKFLTDGNIENFCYGFERNTLEGLGSCVCELGLVPFLEEKTHLCYRRPSFPSQIDEITTPKWKINLIQEHENQLRCSCRVTKNLLPSSGKESLHKERVVQLNTLLLLRFLFTDEAGTNL